MQRLHERSNQAPAASKPRVEAIPHHIVSSKCQIEYYLHTLNPKSPKPKPQALNLSRLGLHFGLFAQRFGKCLFVGDPPRSKQNSVCLWAMLKTVEGFWLQAIYSTANVEFCLSRSRPTNIRDAEATAKSYINPTGGRAYGAKC